MWSALPKFARPFSQSDDPTDPELKQLIKSTGDSSEPVLRTHVDAIKYIPLINHLQLLSGQCIIILPKELPNVILICNL
jgi:arsenate reductase-like glutaredoxin family protein